MRLCFQAILVYPLHIACLYSVNGIYFQHFPNASHDLVVIAHELPVLRMLLLTAAIWIQHREKIVDDRRGVKLSLFIDSTCPIYCQ